MVVSRDLFVEEDTRPALDYPGEMVEGSGPESFPPLGGYLRAFAKPAAQVMLSAREQDPLLVSWYFFVYPKRLFRITIRGHPGTLESESWVLDMQGGCIYQHDI